MIQINVLRISADSKFLEFDIECPEDYRFSVLNIRRYKEPLKIYDLKGQYEVAPIGSNIHKQVMRIDLTAFPQTPGFHGNMFYVEFGIEWAVEGVEPPVDCTLFNQTGVCSDVANVYTHILSQLLQMRGDCCDSFKITPEIERIFILTYAHEEAMKHERFREAEDFYDVISRNFQSCFPNERLENPFTPCNCGG